MNLFLVDDDPIIRAGISKIIEKSGEAYTVVGEASDGEMALEAIRANENIDLILTDIRMPIMDGLELIREIRKFNIYVRIVVLSGYDDYRYVRNAFMDGAVDYLLKPIVKKDLLQLLQKIENQIQLEAQKNLYENPDDARRIKMILCRLIQHKYETECEYKELLDALDLKSDTQAVVMILKTCSKNDEPWEWGYSETVLEDSLMRLNNIFSLDDKYRFFGYVENKQIVILVVAEEKMNEKELTNKYYLYIKNTPLQEQTAFTMGVSSVYPSIADAEKMYYEAVAAIKGSFYWGIECAINFSDIKPYKVLSDNFEKEKELLCEAFSLCDYIKVKHGIDDIYEKLYGAAPDEVRKNIHFILEYLVLHVKDFAEALSISEYDYNFFVSNVNTIMELKKQACKASKNIIESIRQERGKRSKRRIEMAKAYIEEHYMEPLTLNCVAEYIELNASYFSNLFKKETNLKFSEYLLEVRMNQAKKLLLNPTIKIYEIGNMIGYEDAISFGRAFKKKVGMSPKEYRNMVC